MGTENWVLKLQLCPTLCDPIDGSPPGSPVPGILQNQGSNLRLLHCRQILYCLSHQGSSVNTYSKFPLAIYFIYVSVCTRRRQWHPTPVLLPRKSHGRWSLVGCSPWSREKSLPKPPASRALCQAKRAPRAALPSHVEGVEERGALPWELRPHL